MNDTNETNEIFASDAMQIIKVYMQQKAALQSRVLELEKENENLKHELQELAEKHDKNVIKLDQKEGK
ncbi:hypothetical protein E6A57_06175 [Lactobacillus crispatus]|uniref:hypothetical protein n=1 Tax=Lactobacillus crispatus TaxID=47770 RepID=UPI0013032F96|nr:hypothetical protein [Lactobacillus crispatus]QGY95050.1 hypothetical protein E6A57_06175 [Lactobacillus crispatus]